MNLPLAQHADTGVGARMPGRQIRDDRLAVVAVVRVGVEIEGRRVGRRVGADAADGNVGGAAATQAPQAPSNTTSQTARAKGETGFMESNGR